MATDPLSLNRQILRLSGLSSGMDTEYVIKGLMMHDQARVDKQNQAKTKLEWQSDAYRDVNLQLRNFREKYLSVLSPETNMFSSSAYNIFDVAMLDDTNAVTITANSSAATGKVKIDSITQLAAAATASSAGICTDDTLDKDTALKDLNLATPLQFVDNKISFSINGQTFEFADDTSVSDMMKEINMNDDADVTIRYSDLTKGFTISSNETGSSSTVEIVNLTGNAFAATDSAFGIAEGTFNGQDAKLHIEDIEVIQSKNSFTIDGINYTLNDTSATSISFNVERDVDSTVDKIKDFIDAYNELVSDLNEKISEKQYSAYKPLTDEQKEAMNEKDIELWEEKAKSGLLYNNSDVSTLLNKMRDGFYTNVEGVGKSPADIGLKTGLWYEKGKITIDETQLRKALQNNPDEVTDLLVSKSSAEDATEQFKQSGLIARISTALANYTDKTTDVSLKNLSENIRSIENRIEDMMDRMTLKEDALWKKYTAMETAMSKLNSQSSWLQAQMSSLSGQA